MTWPFEFQNAQRHFTDFLRAVADRADVEGVNASWTIVDAVLTVFARRLDPAQMLDFAHVLPPLLRAMFIGERTPNDRPVPFAAREHLTIEVLAIRQHHNFAPNNAIEIVAQELRWVTNPAEFEAVLARLPPEATDYWRV